MKKVLFILNDLGGGGAERVFVNIANNFVENNIDVEFLVGEKNGVYLSILNSLIPVTEIGGKSFLKYLQKLPGILKKNNYSHIFTASHYVSSAAIISKKTTGVAAKIYVTHHFSYPSSRELKYLKGDTILKFIHFFITPFADKIIAVSEGSLQWLRTFSHRKLPQGICIYNPVFDETIYSLSKVNPVFPVDTNGKKVLLSIGRLAEQKDHLTLIKAFSVFKKNKNAVLFILGTGALQSKLENCIKELNLSSSVFLIGFEANPYKWIANCDVLVLPSLFEGFGNVIVEAMALGKTVVSTNCPSGPAEILHDGALGYLCPVKDHIAMAAAIEEAIKFPIKKEALIEAANKYKTRAIVKEYMEIL